MTFFLFLYLSLSLSLTLERLCWLAAPSAQVCELLTEAMQEHDRTAAVQYGMSPGLAVGRDGETVSPEKVSEVNRYTAQRTSCPTM